MINSLLKIPIRIAFAYAYANKQEHEVSKQQNTSDSLLHDYIAAREAEDHIKSHREVVLKELA